jgi:hypothetical protein
MLNRRLAILLAVACALGWPALAGCGGGDHTEDRPPPVESPIPLTDPARVSFPLDAYRLTGQEYVDVNRAIRILGGECMRRFGLTWRPPDPPSTFQLQNERRYGVIDPHTAATRGYHPPAPMLTPPEPDRAPEPSPADISVWAGQGQRSYKGMPILEGGCVGEATRKLSAGASIMDTGFVSRLVSQVGDQAEADQRVGDAFSAWSSCLREAGFDYRDPWTANNDPAWQRTEISTEEIATATADVRCKQRVNLIGIWYAVEVAYQKQAIEKHGDELDRIRDQLRAQVTNARRR